LLRQRGRLPARAGTGGPAGDESHRRRHGQPECHAARDVEGQVGAGVHPGQAHGRDGDQDEGAAAPAEPGEGRRAEGGGDSGVPGQVSQPGGRAAAAADARQQRTRPGPPHDLLDQLRERPGAGAGGQELACQLAFPGKPRQASSHRNCAKGTELHDGPGGRVNRVGQAVDRAKSCGLGRADAVAARCPGRDQYDRRPCAKPDPGIG
jgi:hypothetical protein